MTTSSPKPIMANLPFAHTDDLRIIVEHAYAEAARRHGNYLDVEHLLLGLLRHPSDPFCRLLVQRGADLNALYNRVAASVGMDRSTLAPVRDLSRWAKAAFERARQEADALDQTTLTSGHLLLALMGEPDGVVYEVLSGVNLTSGEVRDMLRVQGNAVPSRPAPRAPTPVTLPSPAVSSRRPAPARPGGVVLVPVRQGGKPRATASSRLGNWPLILGGLGLFIAYLAAILPGRALLTFGIVLAGWIFSVTLHEFAHALVAYWGGDTTVKEKGYLSFNPLKYAHPMLSFGLPLLFLALGGIGLPGGAVYIERHRLRNKWWGAAVSAAGPAANLLLAVLLASPFILGLVDTRAMLDNLTLWSAVAFLAMLQLTAVVFNLIPVPPLDGFGIVEPFMDAQTIIQFRRLGGYSLMLIFLLLWFVPPASEAFWNMIFGMCRDLQIPGWLISEGFWNFMFWRQPPQ